MIRYIFVRLVGLVLVLLVLSMITFWLMHGVPGGPWAYGQQLLSDQQLAALKARYGLDKPMWEQYLIWLGGVVRLDFGMSFKHPDESVLGLIARTWPTTLHLGLMTLTVAFGIGVPLGILSAIRQNTWVDYLATLMSVFGFVTPHFVWGILFILTFALWLKLTPTGGWEGPQYWILPVLAYAFAPIATIARYTRAAMVEALRADYVRTARAKGLSERSVLSRHVMRNAMIPMVTVFGPLIPDLITGSIFIESIFRIPGLGSYWVTSTFDRDYPMIIGLVILWAVLIAITYLITDILYVFLDPRVRIG
ncbi:MAG: ABC transporter permease [Caldilineaceae bacterium]|nr:ABC transporter permease [Caldilineaceae bacterium]